MTDEKQSRQEALQVYALGRKGDEQSINGLVKIIEVTEPGIRATAVRVLGRSKRDELVDPRRGSQKRRPSVKIEAAILLYQVKPKQLSRFGPIVFTRCSAATGLSHGTERREEPI